MGSCRYKIDLKSYNQDGSKIYEKHGGARFSEIPIIYSVSAQSNTFVHGNSR
jgi:hypothetical protein